MKREARLLKEKALNSLLSAVEHFNRPVDRGRNDAVLIFLGHSFEMLLKAGIVHKEGKIQAKKAPNQTHTFGKCLSKARSDGQLKFLTEEQALTLQTIHEFRNAAQHYLLTVSEQLLYLYTQSGVTLFGDLLHSVFGQKLSEELPERVLPVSTQPPKELAILLADEVQIIKKLSDPMRREKTDDRNRLRGLAIMEAVVKGEESVQPSVGYLDKIINRIEDGEPADSIFPGIFSLALSMEGEGRPVHIRFSRREGVPVRTVPEGTADASAVVIRRVNELDFYSMGAKELAKKVDLTMHKTLAVIWKTKLQGDVDCFKKIRIGKQEYKRYSPKALEMIQKELPNLDIGDVSKSYYKNVIKKGQNQP